jgi:signal peptidase I
MEPALYNGDVIFVINHNSILYETINKNDVVLIEEILIRKKILIKRVNKIINKTKLENDSFTKNSQSKNLYYILGDNVSCSIDSRYFGPVPEENIIGKAVLVFLCYHNGKFRWDRFFKRIE